MFTGKDKARDSAKDSRKPSAAPQVHAPKDAPNAGDSRPGASAASPDAAVFDGLTIEDYAKKSTLTEAEIWRRLRRGELFGRSQKGHLIIYKSPDATPAEPVEPSPTADLAEAAATPLATPTSVPPPANLAGATPDLDALPPLPPTGGDWRSGATAAAGLLPVATVQAPSNELALLIDHLSLAKEENREILRMTQEAIRKVTELSDTVVGMKDAVIEAKESQIMGLQEQIATRDEELRRLRQQNEDLEMLARAMAIKS